MLEVAMGIAIVFLLFLAVANQKRGIHIQEERPQGLTIKNRNKLASRLLITPQQGTFSTQHMSFGLDDLEFKRFSRKMAVEAKQK